MITDINLETKLIEQFVVQPKRERYLGFIQQERTRSKFIADLCRADVFQEELFTLITGHEHDAILQRLRSFPYIKEAYIISQNTLIDRTTLDISRVLKEALSPWADTGTLIIFGDVDLVYWETDGLRGRWLSIPAKA